PTRPPGPGATRREATQSWAAEAPPAQPSSTYLTPALLTAMERTLVRGEQGILFLNRRVHSTVLQCRGCGWFAACARCDVSLTVHTEDQTLRCHYCGATRRLLPSCKECGACDLWLGGVGVQEIQRETARLFPHARLSRLDFDAVRKRGAAGAILRSFRQ